MSNVEKLLEELRGRPETEGFLRECAAPDYAETLLSVAGQLGIETEVDAAEIRAYLREVEESRRASTDQVIEEMTELDDDDLEAVAGGTSSGDSSEIVKCPDNHRDDIFACKINDKCGLTWNCRDFMF